MKAKKRESKYRWHGVGWLENRRVKGLILLEVCVGFMVACSRVLLLGITIKQNRRTGRQIEKRVGKVHAEYILRHSDKKTLLVHDHVHHKK